MEKINKLINSLLPGNYWLTKSMELNKVESSGTLWYTKKFLVLYNFIFLEKKYVDEAVSKNIADLFNKYINSMPASIRSDAEKFFFSEKEIKDFRSPDFKTFAKFVDDQVNFQNPMDKIYYENDAKKFYFNFLMGSGGQKGIKKMLKEYIESPDFTYNPTTLDSKILEFAKLSLISDLNEFHCVKDNSIKYCISKKVLNALENKSKTQTITLNDVENEINENPSKKANSNQICNDVHAFLRNHRQILFYYGFVHSKSNGASDLEFSSLTPIGELSIRANFYEFIAIWEHQKIKMVSQPPVVKMYKIPNVENAKDFSIEWSPYLSLLNNLDTNNQINLQNYKFILARKNKNFDCNKNWNLLVNNFEIIKNKISSFDRPGDINDEDFRKELAKYKLGLMSDIKLDKGCNPIGCISSDSLTKITNRSIFNSLLKVFKLLDSYKTVKYFDVLDSSEKELKKQYIYLSSNIDNNCEYKLDKKVKNKWNLYIMSPDMIILLPIALILSLIENNLNLEEIDTFSSNKINNLLIEKFPNFLHFFNINDDKSLTLILKKFALAICNNDSDILLQMSESQYDEYQVKNEISTDGYNLDDLKSKILQLSENYSLNEAADRKRYKGLINLLKMFYIDKFGKNGKLYCECCGEELFLKENNEPYMEFHHVIPFKEASGPDHYLNLIAICPKCHRKFHFAKASIKDELYNLLNKNNYLKLTIIQRIKILKEQNILQSYHLEFLYAQNAISEREYNEICK